MKFALKAPYIWEFPKIRGALLWGSDNRDPTGWGTILGSPMFGNSHMFILWYSYSSYEISGIVSKIQL